MKQIKLLIAAIAFAGMAMPVQAQKMLKKVITIQLPEGDGTNAGSIIWNPVTKKYYTSIIGNAIYAMGVYDAKGKAVQENVEAEYDYRGFWYNPVSKRIEFNCYDSGGIGHLQLDAAGKIKNKIIDFPGMNQPSDQSVGTYMAAGNTILYLDKYDYSVQKYNAKTGETVGKLVKLYAACKTNEEAEAMDDDTEALNWELRNASSVQYTGMPKQELAILNHADRKVEFYDQKTGLMSKTFLKIPESVTIHESFNFCYNNGIWWFFDKEARKWVGCK